VEERKMEGKEREREREMGVKVVISNTSSWLRVCNVGVWWDL
jgi:hypothetical protein